MVFQHLDNPVDMNSSGKGVIGILLRLTRSRGGPRNLEFDIFAGILSHQLQSLIDEALGTRDVKFFVGVPDVVAENPFQILLVIAGGKSPVVHYHIRPRRGWSAFDRVRDKNIFFFIFTLCDENGPLVWTLICFQDGRAASLFDTL